MYGASDVEFRPTALRGILRYWFRAVALGIYSHSDCKNLESELFGTIEPQAQEGKIRIAVDWTERQDDRNRPHYYESNIVLEAKQSKYLSLIDRLLQLSSHLAGIGRGSRRPLHWNNPYPGLRGCYWELETNILPCDDNTWKQFFIELKNTFIAVKTPSRNIDNCSPGEPNNRYQDVLNQYTAIYLVSTKSISLQHPAKINNWQQDGIKTQVRGTALDLLYQNQFKGVNKNGEGNNKVGGAFDTPSYVVIKSNFPQLTQPYQAVTIFGVDQRDRTHFCQEIEHLGGIKIDW